METSDFNEELKKEEKKQKKCFCCHQLFYPENGHDVCIAEGVNKKEEGDIDDPQDEIELNMLMCSSCFKKLLEVNGWESCDTCGRLSTDLESHIIHRQTRESPEEWSDSRCRQCR